VSMQASDGPPSPGGAAARELLAEREEAVAARERAVLAREERCDAARQRQDARERSAAPPA